MSLTARCLKAFTPADFPSTTSRFDFYKLLKNNMPTYDGKPKWPVKLSDSRLGLHRTKDNKREPATRLVFGSVGGGCRDRTDDPLLAKQVLSQLS